MSNMRKSALVVLFICLIYDVESFDKYENLNRWNQTFRHIRQAEEDLIVYSTNLVQEFCPLKCSFYSALESNERCGPTGYPLSVGIKLCQELTSYQTTFNEEGQQWLRDVKRCVMSKLLTKNVNGCIDLATKGFKFQYQCFLAPSSCPTTFCSVFRNHAKSIVKLGVYFSKRYWRELSSMILDICFG